MKKTIVALMALAGVAMADTLVWDLGTSVIGDDYLYDAETGLFTDNPNIDGTVLNSVNGASQIQTNITFVLNLTRAMAVTADTKLLDMDMGGDIGLCLTSTGLATTWNGSTSSARGSVSYDDLLADSSIFTAVNGDTCITLTFAQSYGSNVGVQVWSNTEKLIDDAGLKASGNTSLSSIYVDDYYIGCLQFTPEWKGDAIVETNAAFDAIVKERIAAAPSVPEPTTATLSLLALAGLAARRRRK